MISGWSIPAPPASMAVAGITIRSTSAHVIVRDICIPGPGQPGRFSKGIWLEQTANVTVTDSTVPGQEIGIDGDRSTDLTLATNTMEDNGHGIDLEQVREASVTANAIYASREEGVEIARSENVTVADNEIVTSKDKGAFVTGSAHITLRNNRLRENVRGALFGDSSGVRVTRNVVAGSFDHGLALSQSDGITVANNTLASNGDQGLLVFDSPEVDILSNVVEGNDIGIEVKAQRTHELHRNNIRNNTQGLVVEDVGETVDAMHNWWGCPDGPDDPACDDVTGDAVYDPWLSEPNSEAGPG